MIPIEGYTYSPTKVMMVQERVVLFGLSTLGLAKLIFLEIHITMVRTMTNSCERVHMTPEWNRKGSCNA